MSSNKQNTVWGIFLITLGLVAMVDIFPNPNEWIKVGILGLGGLAAFSVYLTNRSNWPLLIPSYVLWAFAGIASIALAFSPDGAYFPAFVMVLIAIPFLFTYFRNKQENWWALIPSYVLLSIIPIIMLEQIGMRDDLIASYVMAVIAFPFLVVYLLNRANWWALIPAYVMFSIGLMVGLITQGFLTDLLIPAYVMWAVALPFIVVYFNNRANWWALIPGGIMGTIGLVFLISATAATYIIPVIMIAVGLWLLYRQFKG